MKRAQLPCAPPGCRPPSPARPGYSWAGICLLIELEIGGLKTCNTALSEKSRIQFSYQRSTRYIDTYNWCLICTFHSSHFLQVWWCANDILTQRDLRIIPWHQVPRELQVQAQVWPQGDQVAWIWATLSLSLTNQRPELPGLSQSEARSPCLRHVRDPGRICAGKQKSELRLLHCVMLRWWYITTLQHYSHSQSHLRTSDINKNELHK